jgi:beta-phosphoglucomutase family hydrolase
MSGHGPRSDRQAGRRSDAAGGTTPSVSLPPAISACLFDLDGVLTKTARLHAEAWKQMFDGYLRRRADRDGVPFRPFDKESDYKEYVDGEPRYDGVRSFLASRGLTLPEGDPADDPSMETVHGLGNRKNDLVQQLIKERGVEVYPGAEELVRTVRARGMATAVVSSSANCRAVLHAAGIESLFDIRVDGLTLSRLHLRGKPAPDSFLTAARELGVEPARAAVFEDAPAGVAAGHAGGFGFVVGVDRVGRPEELRTEGADVVVSNLAELLA